MKMVTTSLSLVVAVLVLSGCSLAPSAPVDTTTPPPNPNNSIWTSIDSGKTWINNFPLNQKVDISNVDVISMVINPFDAKNVFVGLRGAGILKTDNGGQDWSYLNFQSQKVYGLDIDSKDGRIIYASGVWQNRGKIFKSTDAGENWTEIYTTAANGPLIIALVIDKNNSNIVYAATSDNQLIKSSDAGTSWKNIFTSNSPVIKIAIDRGNSGVIYGLTQAGTLLRSSNEGKTFEDLTKNLAVVAKSNQNLSVLETAPNFVYVAGGAGMYRSSDTGKSWEKIEILSNSQNFPVKAIAINPANARELIYGAAQAVYRSLDGGANWATFQFNIGKSVNLIKYSALDPARLYLGFAK